jgi:hypothetical protein
LRGIASEQRTMPHKLGRFADCRARTTTLPESASPTAPACVRFGMLERVRFDVMPFDVTAPRPTPTADGQPLRLAASVPDPHAGAFEAAYAAAWLPVFRFALAWTNDWSAAEDLT